MDHEAYDYEWLENQKEKRWPVSDSTAIAHGAHGSRLITSTRPISAITLRSVEQQATPRLCHVALPAH
jgi:hypothetical protein